MQNSLLTTKIRFYILAASGNSVTPPAAVANASPVVQPANPVQLNLVQPVNPVQVNLVQPVNPVQVNLVQPTILTQVNLVQAITTPKPSRFMPVIISATSTPPPENPDLIVQPVKLVNDQPVVQGGNPLMLWY